MSTRLPYRVRAEAVPRVAVVPAARRLAQDLLRPMRERWLHTVGVAARAAELGDTVASGDRDILVAAAWLHDIGYSSSIQDSGFHPVDGALFLRRHGWPARICALVAHHSGARFMAAANGWQDGLRQFAFERSPVSDALTYADQTVGPYGQRLDLEDRLADTIRRHGPDSPQARIHEVRAPYLRAAADRVRHRGAADFAQDGDHPRGGYPQHGDSPQHGDYPQHGEQGRAGNGGDAAGPL